MSEDMRAALGDRGERRQRAPARRRARARDRAFLRQPAWRHHQRRAARAARQPRRRQPAAGGGRSPRRRNSVARSSGVGCYRIRHGHGANLSCRRRGDRGAGRAAGGASCSRATWCCCRAGSARARRALARAMIRTLVGDPALEVPSPSFALVQPYEAPGGPVLHADLYRLRERARDRRARPVRRRRRRSSSSNGPSATPELSARATLQHYARHSGRRGGRRGGDHAMSRRQLYTIAPHGDFLDAAGRPRARRHAARRLGPRRGPFWLSDVTIILPTRRARLALAEIFARRGSAGRRCCPISAPSAATAPRKSRSCRRTTCRRCRAPRACWNGG